MVMKLEPMSEKLLGLQIMNGIGNPIGYMYILS